jgi:hypothetical protein
MKMVDTLAYYNSAAIAAIAAAKNIAQAPGMARSMDKLYLTGQNLGPVS